jgi:dTDP-4-amino-4,6-dideoxygalactose transaminase
MSETAAAVREGIQGLPGIRMRKRPDAGGDTGYAIHIERGGKDARDKWIRKLQDQGIPASTLSGSVLLPIQQSLMKKRARHPDWPSFNSPEIRVNQYGPECCQQTLEIFDRFVQVRIGPRYTTAMTDRIVDAVREVYPLVT